MGRRRESRKNNQLQHDTLPFFIGNVKSLLPCDGEHAPIRGTAAARLRLPASTFSCSRPVPGAPSRRGDGRDPRYHCGARSSSTTSVPPAAASSSDALRLPPATPSVPAFVIVNALRVQRRGSAQRRALRFPPVVDCLAGRFRARVRLARFAATPLVAFPPAVDSLAGTLSRARPLSALCDHARSSRSHPRSTAWRDAFARASA